MNAAADDWRRMGQEKFLPAGTVFVLKRYRAYSKTWEHDHCEFCWAKFMDPDYSQAHQRHIEEHPEVLTEGYATTSAHEHGTDYHWVCPSCFDDFAQELGWQLAPTTKAP